MFLISFWVEPINSLAVLTSWLTVSSSGVSFSRYSSACWFADWTALRTVKKSAKSTQACNTTAAPVTPMKTISNVSLFAMLFSRSEPLMERALKHTGRGRTLPFRLPARWRNQHLMPLLPGPHEQVLVRGVVGEGWMQWWLLAAEWLPEI